MYHIGIDLGGTKIGAGLADGDGNLLHEIKIPTEGQYGKDHVYENIRGAVRELLRRESLAFAGLGSIGLGFPGAVERKRAGFHFAPNLACLNGGGLREIFPEMPLSALFVENDANAAALGEFAARKGENIESLIMLTLGTGVGCGIVLGGRIYTGFNGVAGEAGHMVIHKNGRRCGCGRRGCFEQYASAGGLVRTAASEMKRSPDSVLWALCGHKAENITSPMIFQGITQKDAAARRAVRRFVRDLSVGVVNLVSLFQPEILVIGGGLSGAGETILAPLRHTYEKNRYPAAEGYTRLAIASRPDAGLLGAALLYTQKR